MRHGGGRKSKGFAKGFASTIPDAVHSLTGRFGGKQLDVHPPQ